MNLSKLNKKISLYSCSEKSANNPLRDKREYNLVLTDIWAEVLNEASTISGTEVVLNVHQYKITLRRRDQIKATWKIVWEDRTLYIDSISFDDVYTYLTCTESE